MNRRKVKETQSEISKVSMLKQLKAEAQRNRRKVKETQSGINKVMQIDFNKVMGPH